MVSEQFEEPQWRKMPKYEKLPKQATTNFENLKYDHHLKTIKLNWGHHKLAQTMGQLHTNVGCGSSTIGQAGIFRIQKSKLFFEKENINFSHSFCVIEKSFCTHLEEGLKIIHINFKVATSKNVEDLQRFPLETSKFQNTLKNASQNADQILLFCYLIVICVPKHML